MSPLFRRSRASQRPRHSASPKARLLLQALEGRLVPATFTVTNTGDAGVGAGNAGDLRYCINQANAKPEWNTIVFDPAVFSGQQAITLSTALPAITNSVTITGPNLANGQPQLTVQRSATAATAFSVFNVKGGSYVTISNIVVSGGKSSTTGAGINETAFSVNLVLDSVTIANNSSATSGGGIFEATGTVTLNNCSVANNTANGSGGGGGAGISCGTGAQIVINNSAISDNTLAIASNGRPAGGAGVFVPALCSATISGSTFSGNRTFGYDGGAALIYGTATISNCTISSNTSGVGGGIGLSDGGTLNLSNSTLFANFAADYGGGVYASGASALTIANCTLANNTAGSAYTGAFGGVNFEGGGGVALDAMTGITQITSSTISGNYTGANQRGYSYGGGGILDRLSQFSTVTGTLAIDNTIISGNSCNPINGNTDISAVPTETITAKYSAFGTDVGYTFTDLGGNLIDASATPTALRLGVLGPYSGPNSTATNPTFLMFPVRYGGTADNAGDPSQAGAGFMDQRGFARPQNASPATNPNFQPDIGAFERTPGPDAALLSAPTVTSAAGAVFTVAYGDTAAINATTLGSANITVTTPDGFSLPVTFVGADASNPNDVIASYQFIPPTSMAAEDGPCTISVAANQVSGTNGIVPAGPIGTILVTIPRTLTVTATGDAGVGTAATGDLLYCMTQANSDSAYGLADTIVFSSSTAGGATNFYDGSQHTIQVSATGQNRSALPPVTGPLTIIGPGASLLSVVRTSGQFTFQFQTIGSPVPQTFAVTGLSVTAAAGVGGTGIDLYASMLNLTDVTISGNGTGIVVRASARGVPSIVNVLSGRVVNNSTGIAISSYGGTANIIDSSVSNNTGGSGAGVNLHIDDTLTITGSTISGNRSSSAGAAIYETGAGATVTISNSTIANNSASGSGGAIVLGVVNPNITNGGSVEISNSTLSSNTAGGNGGAISAANFIGTVSITNSTIANNTAGGTGGSGGGILLQSFQGTLGLTSCTVTANSSSSTVATVGYGGGGIADLDGSGMLNLDNSIVAANSAVNGNSDIAAPTNAAITTTYSAIGNTSGFAYSPGPGDLPIGTNLNLQPLANNGGPTQTIAFAANSPLLNAGDPALANTTDQRGVARTIGPAPDIGAYEYQPITIANVQVNDGSAQRSEVRSITVTFSGPVSFAGGNAAAAFQLLHVQTGNDVILGATTSTNAAGQTVVTLSFSGSETDPVSAANGGIPSLADGRYQLTVLGSAVTDAALGWTLDGNNDGTPGGNYVSPTETNGGPGGLHLYRLFADVNGDGTVDAQDLGQFRSAFNSSAGSALYLSYLDADNSGAVDSQDLGQFRSRYNTRVF